MQYQVSVNFGEVEEIVEVEADHVLYEFGRVEFYDYDEDRNRVAIYMIPDKYFIEARAV